MEKMALNIVQVLNSNAAIVSLLRKPGLPPERVYWLDRLRKKLEPHIKRYERQRQEVFLKHSIIAPNITFVPYHAYAAFKEEILNNTKYGIGLDETFANYETVSEHAGQRVVEVEKREVFEKDLEEIESSMECEIEFNKIGYDAFVESALTGIPGELQLSLEYAFDKSAKSNIVVVQSTQGEFKI
jgi:hypothetical protein